MHSGEIYLESLNFLYRNVAKGNIIDWTIASWDVSYMTKLVSNYSEICGQSEHEMQLFVFPYLTNMKSSDRLCKKLKGKSNIITNSENQNQVVSLMEKQGNCHKGWIYGNNIKNCYYSFSIYSIQWMVR